MIHIRQTLLPLLLFLSLATLAQKKDPVLLLKEGKVKTSYNINESTVDHFNNKAIRYRNKAFAVLQFEHLPSAETRSFLSRQGIELLEYIPENAYTVTISGKLNTGLLKKAGARTILQLTPTQKMHSALAKGDIPAWARKVDGLVDVAVSFPKSYKAADVVQYLRDEKMEVLSTQHASYQILEVRLAAGRLEELASFPFVEYVEPVPPDPQPLNANSRNGARAGVLHAAVSDGGKGLTGEGVVIGIGDDGNVQSHPDLTGPRLMNTFSENAAAGYHAIHVSTTTAGAGVVNELHKGLAPKATIISRYMSYILADAGFYAQKYGMVLTNNSYGGSACGYYGEYTAYSKELDQQALDFPYLQHVFAAGNGGRVSCGDYPVGFHAVVGGYQAAKNVITVGATEWNGSMWDGSSRGPVKDGRTKPDITAMGSGVYSGGLNSGYGYGWGTSMAAPAVTGGMALLYQRYRQLHGGQNPKNGLMKALLCNGGADLGNKGPDYQYGFGWMNLLRSVEVLEKGHFKIDSLTNGGEQRYTITVPSSTAQVKVMLYWNDPPASLLGSRTLVNDLDLSVSNPSLIVNLPRVLDPSAAGVLNVATTGADHINNMEQVVIDNPAPGTYTVNISGVVAQNPSQEYFLVYDILPVSTTLTYPAGGEGLVPGETVQINWDAYGEPAGTFSLKYSIDGGASWTDIATAVEATSRRYAWVVPNTPTHQALIRIERNGTGLSHTTHSLTILGAPTLSLAPVQCEGYIALSWTAVPGATDYEVMLKKDNEMVPVATTARTTYALTGLSPDSLYWVSVRARLGGKPGRRAVAISRQPDSGTCAGSLSDNDLKLEAIVRPHVGRKYTSTELSATSKVTIRVKNLDDESVTGFTAKYKVDNRAWVTETVQVPIPARTTYDYTFAATEDLSGVGSYSLVTVVENLSPDAIKSNDTLQVIVRQLDNQPLDLTTPFLDDLEGAAAAVYTRDAMGLTGIDRYDFIDPTAHGRLSTFGQGRAFSGTKSFELSSNRYTGIPEGEEYVVGTYNLSRYQSNSHHVRLDFKARFSDYTDYRGKLWVRGRDDQAWVELLDFESYFWDTDFVSIDLSDSLLKRGQNFSSSFQLRWSNAPGYTGPSFSTNNTLLLDDIKIYEVFDDLQLLDIDAATKLSCVGESLSISVRNSSNKTLTNVPVRFRIDSGAWITEVIPAVAAQTTFHYTFRTPLSFTAPGVYTLTTLVDLPTDSYRLNDTLSTTINFTEYTPVIRSFPYLQNFESGKGGWSVSGSNSDWEFGTPASAKINKAASGIKAWIATGTSDPNDYESWMLYSPCFDIGSMSNPTLSFSLARDLAGCASSPCELAWVEYSIDNSETWQVLVDGAAAGINWYAPEGNYSWDSEKTRWHVVTIPLPKHTGTIRLRIARYSDPGVQTEGIAIDDIHIYDSIKAIYEGVSPSITAAMPLSGNGWVHFESGGQLIASIHPNGQNLGTTEVQAFIHSGTVRNTNEQYYLNRSITIKPQVTTLTDSVTVRMYFLDSESEALLAATGCSGCTKPASAYKLGVSKYSDPDDSKENSEICDNGHANNWVFIGGRQVAVVPFQKGYYIEFKVKDFSEFWLHNGGADQRSPLTSIKVTALDSVCVDGAGTSLSAAPAGGTWSGSGVSGGVFNPAVAGVGSHTLSYTYTDAGGCTEVATTGIVVNPLPVITLPVLSPVQVDGSLSVLSGALPAGGVWSGRGVSGDVFSPASAGVGTHTLTYSYTDAKGCASQATTSITVTPVPVKLVSFTAERAGMEDVQAAWMVQEETTILRYELELAKGDAALTAGQFVTIGAVPARHSNAPTEQYFFTDGEPVKVGRRHYRLKLIAPNGNITYSEVRTVEFPSTPWVVYPNPSSGTFYMLYQVGATEHLEASVYDARGRLIKQYRRQGNGALQRLEVDLSTSTFAAGVYLLQTMVNGRKKSFKLQKL